MSPRDADVVVVTPFRPPTFRHAISPTYPLLEPLDSPPYQLAGEIREAGFSCAVLPLQSAFAGYNAEADAEALLGLLNGVRARLVLFATDHFIASRSSAGLYGIRTCARMLRDLRPTVRLGVTGRLATTWTGALFDAVPGLDLCVVGEAEAGIGDIVRAVLAADDARPLAAGDRPAGLVLREDAGHTTEPLYLADPSDGALPAFDLLPDAVELQGRYGRATQDVVALSLRTSLGCKFRCRFCAGVPHWRDYRTKSPERLGAELDLARAAVGDDLRVTFLEDEVFSRRPEHVAGIGAVMQAREMRIGGVYTHATMVDDATARRLASFVDKVYLGLDSADDGVLRRMGKGQKLETVLGAVATASRAGLAVHLEWIVGSPDEDVDSLGTSLIAIFNLLVTGAVDSVNTYVYCPHPGTEYAERADTHGLTIHGDPEAMQESGGYPAAATRHLSRQQIFTAYLMSQVVIHEAEHARRTGGTISSVARPDRAALTAVLDQFAVPGHGGKG